MDKITFSEFIKVMEYDLNKKTDPCIEICLCVDECMDYSDIWITKTIDPHTRKDVYGFGLAMDGSQEYNYDSFDEFASATIFYGNKNLKEIWNTLSVVSLDGGQVYEVLPYFLKLQQ